MLGEHEAAIARLTQCLEIARAANFSALEAETLAAMASASYAAGRELDARQLARDAAELIDGQPTADASRLHDRIKHLL